MTMFEVSRLQINMAPPVISKDIACNKGANRLIVIAVEPSAHSGKWSGSTGTELLKEGDDTIIGIKTIWSRYWTMRMCRRKLTRSIAEVGARRSYVRPQCGKASCPATRSVAPLETHIILENPTFDVGFSSIFAPMALVERPDYQTAAIESLHRNGVTAILGPRQSGKSTLARMIAEGIENVHWFDLDIAADEEVLSSSPRQVLSNLKGLIVLDEIQRLPDLFRVLRVLVDEDPDRRFLILGSASPDIIRGTSDTLAGRIGFVDLIGFNLGEVGQENLENLWIRGGFPRSFLADTPEESYQWRQDFARTFLERDLRQLGINVSPVAMRRFWTMLAHLHGHLWNGAVIARSLGVSEQTTRRYLDMLTGAYMIRQIQPWFENVKKRQVKAPKIYFRDSGLLHALLQIQEQDFWSHPTIGTSWEGFVIEQLIAKSTRHNAQHYFWATHAGAELDLLMMVEGNRIGYEIKRSERPKITKSMRSAMETLKLDRLYLIYPGDRSLELDSKIFLLPAKEMLARQL